jgi:hypothetical protein
MLKRCEFCEKEYKAKNKKQRYCSRSCAIVIINRNRKDENRYLKNCRFCSKEFKSLNSSTCSPECRKSYGRKDFITVDCLNCNTELFISKSASKYNKFCNRLCFHSYRKKETLKNETPLKKYRNIATFDFNLLDYPDEFNYYLVEKYGWYNSINNKDGISRDHIFSISSGFRFKVDPIILSHPANCNLMKHSSNISKGYKCYISVGKLIEKIKLWNIKYEKEIKNKNKKIKNYDDKLRRAIERFEAVNG